MRLAVEGMKHNGALARQLEARLVGAPGVREVSANLATGTLLVTYEAGWDWSDDPQTLASSLAANSAEAQVDALANRLLESSRASTPRGAFGASAILPLAIGLLGGRAYLTLAEFVVPAWYDLLCAGLGSYALLGKAGVSTAEAAQDAVEIATAI